MCGDLYLWRQIFILITGLFLSTSVGFMITFPAVLNPAILSANTTDIRATPSQASWIAASNGLAGAFGFLIQPPILQIFGRKAFHVVCCLFHLIGWIIFPLAKSLTNLFAARIIQGIAIGGVYIQSIIVCEYVHPERRGYFITIKKISTAVATLVCHSLTLAWDWRQISTFAIAFPLIGIILTFFWPESPYYLAMKGRFEESEKSFKWLRGSSCNEELHQLLMANKERIRNLRHNKKVNVKKYLEKDFMTPFLVVSLMTLLLDLSGKYYVAVYLIQIMLELMGDMSIAVYCSLASDFLLIAALIASCFLIRRFKRRTMLTLFSSLSISFMFLISLVIFLKRYDIGSQLVWLPPLMIAIQSFIVNIGLIPVSFTLVGEVFPLEYKGVGSCASGIVFTLFYALTTKITPSLMNSIGLDGMYTIFAVSSVPFLVLLYFILPETKDKTLQQIEDEIKGEVRTIYADEKLGSVERNTLL